MIGRGFSVYKEVRATKALTKLWADGTPKASSVEKWAGKQGFSKVAEDGKPVKFMDKNGVNRMTIKEGSARTPGSENPHVEARNGAGQRIDPTNGNPVPKRSPGNHRSINLD